MGDPIFLSAQEVLRLHDTQLRLYGGLPGVRDLALLESALAMPAMQFDGEFLHPDIFEMAGAYLFHLAKNHPFNDGNKRTALHAAYVFLRINGFVLTMGPDALYELTLAVAEGRLDKSGIAMRFRESSHPAT